MSERQGPTPAASPSGPAAGPLSDRGPGSKPVVTGAASLPIGACATVAEALAWCRTLGLDRLDAQLILAAATGQSRAWLLAHDHDPLPPDAAARVAGWATRHAQGEPLAYLLGDKEFHGLTLKVGPDVLIPRPDTETLVDWALELLATELQVHPAPRVLDLGTGSGAIALALAQGCPRASVSAVDASAPALSIARDNAARLGLPVRFLHGHWLAPVQGERFELIASNPPYIAEGDPHLPALAFEPRSALTAGPDGLDDLRHLAAAAPACLVAGGWLLLEHGHEQDAAVRQLLADSGFTRITTRRDLGDRPRCTGGQWRGRDDSGMP